MHTNPRFPLSIYGLKLIDKESKELIHKILIFNDKIDISIPQL